MDSKPTGHWWVPFSDYLLGQGGAWQHGKHHRKHQYLAPHWDQMPENFSFTLGPPAVDGSELPLCLLCPSEFNQLLQTHGSQHGLRHYYLSTHSGYGQLLQAARNGLSMFTY